MIMCEYNAHWFVLYFLSIFLNQGKRQWNLSLDLTTKEEDMFKFLRNNLFAKKRPIIRKVLILMPTSVSCVQSAEPDKNKDRSLQSTVISQNGLNAMLETR